MFNYLTQQPQEEMQTANILGAYMQPILEARRQNALSAREETVGQAVSDGYEYNALAAHGGPTKAAAQAVSNFDLSGAKGEIATGIIEAANELGVDPVDLATAISYETAGTFDPTKKGPTTQWGQHKGMIQFGEPQAAQYGVDWSDPVGSQLGSEGAVVKYLRGNGVTPGMGLLDIYSTINAGAPGLYHRSDANNGGAPGNVRDKVETQMDGHRQNALRLLQDL